MADESNRRDWFEGLEALPIPVAVLDADYHFLLLSRASAADPLLARSRVGRTDLGCFKDEPAVLEQARERHRQYERSLLTQEPLLFAEETSTADGRQHFLWLCVPVRVTERARLIVIGISADRAKPEAMLQFLHKTNKELRAPLAALVGLAGTLAHELSGEQQARAALIDQSGRRLLRQLSLLMEQAEQSPRYPTHHEQG